jgi:hypothetical protein
MHPSRNSGPSASLGMIFFRISQICHAFEFFGICFSKSNMPLFSSMLFWQNNSKNKNNISQIHFSKFVFGFILSCFYFLIGMPKNPHKHHFIFFLFELCLCIPVLTTVTETGLFMTSELKRQAEEDKTNSNKKTNIIFAITIVNFVTNYFFFFFL